MRLKLIKLAGFKSFVDPTKVPFPDAMTAIVGPNGCGKSNVIDAVRWVLGESSAKNLRGDAMTDVIFNGSTGRKASSVASVELVFDNSEGRLQGQYGSYAEISVKRQVNSDAQSSYFLNGSKCRRRDITDLFAGTGLGPRSYAIIEQGTVSRLIESKPQELRVFIEEAAGISRYKERRRETENRIRHTRENLERLQDVRTELAAQIERLHRQAEAARRFRTLKAEEQTLQGQVLALKWRELTEQISGLDGRIAELEREKDQRQDAVSGDEAELVRLQQQKSDLTAELEQQRQQWMQGSATVTRLEQQILHTRQQAQQLEEGIRQLQSDQGQSEAQLTILIEEQQALEAELIEQAPQTEQMVQQAQLLEEALERQMAQSERLEQSREQQRANKEQAERTLQVNQVERAAITRERQQIQQQQAQLQAQSSQWLNESEASARRQVLVTAITESEQALAFQQHTLDQTTEAANGREREREATQAERAAGQEQQAKLAGRLHSLETLIQARQPELPAPFDRLPRAWQQIQVMPGWEAALEQVLGAQVQAVIGADELPLPAGLSRLAPVPAEAAFPQDNTHRAWPRLLECVDSPFNLEPWLGHVYCADSLELAQQRLAQCDPHESMVLSDGRWLGRGFEIAPGSTESPPLTALLAQQQETEAQLSQVVASLTTVEKRLQDTDLGCANDKRQIEQQRSELQRIKEELRDHQVTLAQWDRELTRQREQRAFTDEQQAGLAERLELLAEKEWELDEQREAQLQLLEQAQQVLADIEQQREQQRENLKQQQAQLSEVNRQLQQGQLRQQQVETRLQGLAQRQVQAREAAQGWQQRLEQSQQKLEALAYPREEYEEALEQALVQRGEIEAVLNEQQEALASLEQALLALNERQRRAQAAVNEVAEKLNQHQLTREGLRAQAQGQRDLLHEVQIDLQQALTTLTPEMVLSQCNTQLEKVRDRIRRLGAINMAAIEEYDQQLARKQYLDDQDRDLTEALEMLESAIRKIDRETRARFKETFERVNADLGHLFPKVFGGGSAYLALTDDDLLEAGVTIMARPPGKKNSTIHLLSGGEKALTALSLVFAIFRLNPAPFCMLDEVDAPLDDANVGRFCRLVKEMSATVQFIYISHNKVSMEMADRLTGVTMHEPGVSRIVAVDIEQAAAMATAG
ncbi:chromosome segregation protein SMC [Ferrimonas gelatinilytica]|uniref:Chromosome partition protein Smc n=1 Tax=Ferrimonas gelatinilytica TaxID=1255257 RepID=A0ABP9S2F4_9GAMM